MKNDYLNKSSFDILVSILNKTINKSSYDFCRVMINELKKLLNSKLIFLIDTKEQKIISSTVANTDIKLPCTNVEDNSIIKINIPYKDDFSFFTSRNMDFYHHINIFDKEKKLMAYIVFFTKNELVLSEDIKSILEICSKSLRNEFILLNKEQEEKKIKSKLEKNSIEDELTGLYNRNYFEKICTDILGQMKRTNIAANFAYLDINDFKKINDEFGYLQGDNILKEIGLILQEQSRKGIDYIFRLGGEEFAIISLNTLLENSYNHLARIMQKTSERFKNTKYKDITFSTGLVEFNKDFTSHEEIIDIAYNKVNNARQFGENIIVK